MIEAIRSIVPSLVTREQAAQISYVERKRHGKVVFTNGVFDILHRGHVEYLHEARSLGHVLIVGLNSDESVRRIKGANRPLNSEEDRAYMLGSLKCVDYVVLFDEDTPAELIATVLPSVLVKGGDYRAEDVVGYDVVTKQGGQVLTIPFREGYSTSSLIETIVERYGQDV